MLKTRPATTLLLFGLATCLWVGVWDISLSFDEWRICLVDRLWTPSDRHTPVLCCLPTLTHTGHLSSVAAQLLPPLVDQRQNETVLPLPPQYDHRDLRVAELKMRFGKTADHLSVASHLLWREWLSSLCWQRLTKCQCNNDTQFPSDSSNFVYCDLAGN